VFEGEGPMECFVAVRSLPVERLMTVDGTCAVEFNWSVLPTLEVEVSTFLRTFVHHPATIALEHVGFVSTATRLFLHADAAEWRAALAKDSGNTHFLLESLPQQFLAHKSRFSCKINEHITATNAVNYSSIVTKIQWDNTKNHETKKT
jgi:hypothetical protein